MSKNKVIPELRFPEFMNDGEWVEMQLGDSLLRNPEYGINAPAVSFSNKLPTYLRITDISEDGRFLSNEKVSVAREVTEDNYLSDGDIVLARTGASVGKSYKYRNEDGRLVFAGFLIRLKPDSNKLNSDFLFQFLATNQYWKWVSFISARSGQPGINATEYSSLPVCLPKPKEQQKVASCLSSLDEVIAAHSQKLELLKDHKKGLMQNLFPQEGEKVPKLRFREFENDGEWVEKILSEVADYENGKAHEQDIDETGDFIVVNSKFISTDGEIAKYSKEAYCIAEKGDILMVLSDVPNGRAIAKCFYVNETNKYTVNQRICKLTPFDCDNLFLYFIMNRNPYFLSFDDGVKQTNLRNDDVQSFSFLIPIDKKEQQKIASCLSSLDDLIAAQAEKIEQLKLHKKGLMQGLFPKMSNVKTGHALS